MLMSTVFQNRLPRRPYCSDDLAHGVIVRPAATALCYRHLQPNAPLEVAWLIFDVDCPGAAFAWDHANLPPPTATVVNPANAHAHLFYGLTSPVCMSDAAREAPIRFAAGVQAAFQARLNADPGYAGLVAKNPLHMAWRTMWVQRLYDLAELAEYVDLPRRRPQREALGLGRNCTLFDEVRGWAYQWVRLYRRNGASADEWRRAVLGQAERLNAFAEPLPFAEVRATARSVATWVWRHFSETDFSAIQSARGKRGGRPPTTTRGGAPWVKQGISRATFYRRRGCLLVRESGAG